MNRQEILKQRAEEHKASVIQNEDGTLEFKNEDIITPKGLKKTNRIISIVPAFEEKIVPASSVKYLFQELKQMNLILTNACNLSCSYCYEQHNKDFGRFTSESLLQSYNWFKNVNTQKRKIFQFFKKVRNG